MSIEEDAQKLVRKVMLEIAEQREEIIRAFVSKYRLNPEECEQVVDFSGYPQGVIRWRIQKREEKKNE